VTGRNVGTDQKDVGRIFENPGRRENGENEGKVNRDLANFQKSNTSDARVQCNCRTRGTT
jgi:hypothetical protein